MTQKKEHMQTIADDISRLKQSPLYEYRKANGYVPVIGEGSYDAQIIFVGEAPGKNEARTGRPFCGAAGKILDELLLSINLDRKNVYITNIIKDRPPENRDPTPDEITLYSPFLKKQIDIIQPCILAPLGRFSTKYILQQFNCNEKLLPIGKIHGTIIPALASYGSIQIIPLYHPAVALYNRKTKETLLSDFQLLQKLL